MRRSKLTQDVQEDICAAIEIGATFLAAATNAGIAYSTLRLWLTQGENALKKQEANERLTADDKRKLALLEAIENSKGIALLTWQQQIQKAAKVDPAWAWKMLAVRAPDDYANTNKMELTGSKGGPLIINLNWGDAEETGDDDA